MIFSPLEMLYHLFLSPLEAIHSLSKTWYSPLEVINQYFSLVRFVVILFLSGSILLLMNLKVNGNSPFDYNAFVISSSACATQLVAASVDNSYLVVRNI